MGNVGSDVTGSAPGSDATAETLAAASGAAIGRDSTIASGDAGADGSGDRAAIDLDVIGTDRYVERAPLTRGGMGEITIARDRRLGRRVALKELRADTPALRARFEREALLTARLEHPSIVTVHEAGRWPTGEPFYAMRLVHGRSLDKVLAAAPTALARTGLVAHV